MRYRLRTLLIVLALGGLGVALLGCCLVPVVPFAFAFLGVPPNWEPQIKLIWGWLFYVIPMALGLSAFAGVSLLVTYLASGASNT